MLDVVGCQLGRLLYCYQTEPPNFMYNYKRISMVTKMKN